MSTAGTLIVSASTGTGHLRAAEALREAYAAADPDHVVEHVDLLDLAPRWVRATYGRGYELISTKTPRLWREIYHRTDAPEGDPARWGPLANRLLFREFRRLLLSRPWRLCLCTHFLPGQLAAGTPGAPPFAMVITDLTLHRFWAQPRVRRFFVANDGLQRALEASVRPARVDVTGIPTASHFGAAPTREEARAALRLDAARPTVLVMGGGLGLGVEAAVHASLRAAVDGLQVMAVCGRNAGAAARLGAVAALDARLRVLGYVDDVERYMAAADLVVTKPGGLTTSEVLAVGRPLLLTQPIPGQEEGNAEVLCRAGAALCARDGAELVHRIEEVFRRAELRTSLAAGAAALSRPDAARVIAATLRAEYGVEDAA